MTSPDGTLMVTKNGHLPIAVIVKLNFLLNAGVVVLESLKQCRHGVRGVVGTENFSTQARHVVRQMFVKLCGLDTLAI